MSEVRDYIEKLNELSKKLEETNTNTTQPSNAQTSESAQSSSQTPAQTIGANSQSAVAASAQNASSTKREIMRFRINGSNILSSITDIYISKPEICEI